MVDFDFLSFCFGKSACLIYKSVDDSYHVFFAPSGRISVFCLTFILTSTTTSFETDLVLVWLSDIPRGSL
jgi:hypothetical protein